MNRLDQKIKLGNLKLNNRIFMAPMTRSRANNPQNAPGELHAKYYTQRSTAGLIISEGIVVSRQANGYINIPGLYTKEQLEKWKLTTEAVHKNGGKIFAQLWHVGRISHPDLLDGELPVAPSAINPNTDVFTPTGLTKTVTPREMTNEDIKQTVNDFAQAAKNAIKAGFDGVEIHSSNGYLFHQFFNNCSNHRVDEYGGNDENKSRFLFEVIDAVAKIIPIEKIGVRLNPMLHGMSGIEVDQETANTFDYIISKLNDYSLAYLHLSRPFTLLEKDFFISDVIGHYRKIYNGFMVANGNYDPDSAEKEIVEGRADAIAFGRSFISNPDLPIRIKNDWPLSEADESTFYTPGEKGYTDYPDYDPSKM